MKNSKILFGLVIMMILMGCAKTPVYKSTWQQPISEENATDEDRLKGMCYDSESGIMYGLSNDHENLYVKMRFDNHILQQKIMKTGLTLWIDTTGKKNKQLGLVFPIKSSPNTLPKAQRSMMTNYDSEKITRQQIDSAMFNAKFRDGMQSMKLVNYFGEGRVNLIDNKNTEGVTAILRLDEESSLYYNAEISLQKIFPNPEKFLNDSTQTFSFGIETGKMEKPSSSNGGGRLQMSDGERGSHGGGGQGGGGQRGGASRSGDGNPQIDSDKMAILKAMSVESKVWVKKACLGESE